MDELEQLIRDTLICELKKDSGLNYIHAETPSFVTIEGVLDVSTLAGEIAEVVRAYYHV